MSSIMYGNILDVVEGMVVHQVNCQGVMGAGLAKQIKQKYPEAFEDYRKKCHDWVFCKQLLGELRTTKVDKNLYIIHLFGQRFYGKDKRQYTDYEAHKRAWSLLRVMFPNEIFFVPFYIGAGLAGGDWKILHTIIEGNIKDIVWVKYKQSPAD